MYDCEKLAKVSLCSVTTVAAGGDKVALSRLRARGTRTDGEAGGGDGDVVNDCGEEGAARYYAE
jgi:hypothetical protein